MHRSKIRSGILCDSNLDFDASLKTWPIKRFFSPLCLLGKPGDKIAVFGEWIASAESGSFDNYKLQELPCAFQSNLQNDRFWVFSLFRAYLGRKWSGVNKYQIWFYLVYQVIDQTMLKEGIENGKQERRVSLKTHFSKTSF